jgi:hypothetical protein
MSRIALLLALAAVAACGGEQEQPAPPPSAPEVPAITVSLDQFKSLKWLEGKWRGTLNDTMPFYEQYRFVNDSTIESLGFADSTMVPPRDTGFITLRAGKVQNGSGDRYYLVSEIDSGSVHFEPRERANNAFTWKREGDGWIATLRWKDSSGNPVQRTYVMKPIGRAK